MNYSGIGSRVKTFIIDFGGVFVHNLYIVVVVILEGLNQLYKTVNKFCGLVVRPAFSDFLADFNLFLSIILQGFYCSLSSFLLGVSKISLKLSQVFHNKSEELIYKNWDI